MRPSSRSSAGARAPCRARSTPIRRIGRVSVQSGLADRRRRGLQHCERLRRPVLTVVVPVYNGGDEIVDNVGVIRRAAAGGSPSDGSRAHRRLGRVHRRDGGALDRRAQRRRHARDPLRPQPRKGLRGQDGRARSHRRLDRDRRRRPRPRPRSDPGVSRDRPARAARLRHRIEASPRLRRLLPAVATDRELAATSS